MESDLLMRLIRERVEIDELCDLCDVGIEDLTRLLHGRILMHREKFESYLEIYNESDET